jgi:tRNA-guanine family transglycosylase
MKTGELTGKVLATVHNVRHYLDFMRHLRQAIGSGALRDFEAFADLRESGLDAPQEGAQQRDGRR